MITKIIILYLLLINKSLINSKYINSMISPSRKIILMSSLMGGGNEMLSYARDQIDAVLKKRNVTTILLIPYASLHYDLNKFRFTNIFAKWGYKIEVINEKLDATDAIRQAETIFICGGNTFVLLKKLYDKNLILPIREQILQHGIPFIGTSAGANVATPSIHTTNDMPVVYPKSLDALNLVPFNINPHYVDIDRTKIQRTETRDRRLQEFIYYQKLPVCALRDGNILYIDGNNMKLLGNNNMKYFVNKSFSREYLQNSDLSFLLK